MIIVPVEKLGDVRKLFTEEIQIATKRTKEDAQPR